MASTPFGWTSSGRGSSGRGPERRTSGEETAVPYLQYTNSFDPRQASSHPTMTSSLTGAVGDVSSRHARPPLSRGSFDAGQNPQWQTHPTTLAGVGLGYSVAENAYGFDQMAIRNTSPPSSLTPPSPGFQDDRRYRSQSTAPFQERGRSSSHSNMPAMNESCDSTLSSDIRQLVRKKQELELACARAQAELQNMQSRMAHDSRTMASSHSGSSSVSSNFQAGWNARTEARTRYLCSLNRAGNALCAWHDSRRERRAFPPRNAPPGYLNCGCTVEEALFEESLARHQVGSYLPGETVRMDPALRNPLLQLLKQRYGYVDGDFERDPVTGDWVPGEGPAPWISKAQSGPANIRKKSDAH